MSEGNSKSPRKGKRGRRGWWILLVVLLIAGGVYAYVQRPWEARAPRVAVEAVAPGPVTEVLAVNGRVAARNTVNVRSPVSGRALEVLASEGDEVAEGDVLVRIDSGQAKALVDQARAALDAGVVKERQARAASDRAQALGENATRSAREDAELALAAASNEVTRLTAALEEAQSQLEQYTVTSPLTGVILDRSVDQGQLVDPQSNLFTIANLSELLVETDVDELYSSRFRRGLEVLLQPVGETVARTGEVVFATPSVDPSTGGRAIKIGFDEPVDLPVGLTVNANIVVSQQDDVLSLPRSAIVTEGYTSHVMVVEDGVVVERQVDFSDWPAERVIVTDGLSEGDLVVLDPASVAPGQEVDPE